MHAVPQLLSGNLGASLSAVLLYVCQKTSSWRMVGERKARTFEEYASLYPEYDYVFCGDNGQGDLLAAEKILKGPWKENVRACFIHRVLEPEKQLSEFTCRSGTVEAAKKPEDPADAGNESQHPVPAGREQTRRNAATQDARIIFSNTYVAAAAKAFELELITLEELIHVMKSTVQEFMEIATLYPKWDSSAAMEILNEDLNSANALIEQSQKEKTDPDQQTVGPISRDDLKPTVSFQPQGPGASNPAKRYANALSRGFTDVLG